MTRIHPSAVTGTEINQKASQQGGLEYQSVPIGRVSRERIARELVRLVERPRQALLVSRLYDPGVIVNQLFPGLVDWAASIWVRRMRRKELRHSGPTAPVRYHGLFSPWRLAALIVGALVIGRLLKKRS